jgi:hypothetical protein
MSPTIATINMGFLSSIVSINFPGKTGIQPPKPPAYNYDYYIYEPTEELVTLIMDGTWVPSSYTTSGYDTFQAALSAGNVAGPFTEAEAGAAAGIWNEYTSWFNNPLAVLPDAAGNWAWEDPYPGSGAGYSYAGLGLSWPASPDLSKPYYLHSQASGQFFQADKTYAVGGPLLVPGGATPYPGPAYESGTRPF